MLTVDLVPSLSLLIYYTYFSLCLVIACVVVLYKSIALIILIVCDCDKSCDCIYHKKHELSESCHCNAACVHDIV